MLWQEGRIPPKRRFLTNALRFGSASAARADIRAGRRP